MDKDEALKQALEALEANYVLVNGTETHGGLEDCLDGYYAPCFNTEPINRQTEKAIATIKEALEQPAQDWKTLPKKDAPLVEWANEQTPPQREWEEWNAALDEAAARINNVRGFGQATQDSFAVYIKGLKK